MAKLSVHLVTWNGEKYIPYLFESLKKQTFLDWELQVLDNASTDNTLQKIKNNIESIGVPFTITENKENSGFAGGHNMLFKKTDSEYFLLLNQDMYLSSNCFENMIEFMDRREDVVAVSPRLMRWNLDKIQNTHNKIQNIEKSFTDQIDAIGMKVFRNRRVVEWMTRHSWQNSDISKSGKRELEVFGVSGAFPLFRRSIINEIVFLDGNMFDESYHSYKEDVDLAFRLGSSGYKSFVLLDTVAYQDRAAAGPKALSDAAAAGNKKFQSSWVKYHSYKNHLVTLYKNEYWQNVLLDLPWIVWYELKKFGWYAVYDRGVLRGLVELWKNRCEIREKRQEIIKKRKMGWGDIRKWWSL